MTNTTNPVVDFLGQDLEIGQRVVFMPPHVKRLEWGYVKTINPKMIRIMFGKNKTEECNRYQKEVIILTEEQTLMLAQQRLSGK